jgi:CheY-like chemotaxis protein
MITSAKTAYRVLVADDCESDRMLFRAALRHAPRLRLVGELADGREVIGYFEGRAPFGDRRKFPLPDLLVLDLKMPFVDGFEVLQWLRDQPLMSHLISVVITDSMDPSHIKRALDSGADLFQLKPFSDRDRVEMVVALEEYVSRVEANCFDRPALVLPRLDVEASLRRPSMQLTERVLPAAQPAIQK